MNGVLVSLRRGPSLRICVIPLNSPDTSLLSIPDENFQLIALGAVRSLRAKTWSPAQDFGRVISHDALHFCSVFFYEIFFKCLFIFRGEGQRERERYRGS